MLAGVPGITIAGNVSPGLVEILEIALPGCKIHHGANLLLEVKMPGKDLEGEQVEFFEEYKGQRDVVFSPEEALDLIGRT